MQTLAQKVLAYIRRHELLRPGHRVGVAVSGGADSVGLLRLLLELRQELGIILSIVHFNHKLRGAESDADQQFVAELARRHKLELRCDRGDVAASVAEKHLSIEAAARKMRYEYFVRLLRAGELNRVATAHTLDDQAETVLMRVVRGAGTRGLAGIYPQLSVASSQFSEGRISAVLSVASSQFSEGQISTVSSVASSQFSPSIARPLLSTRRKELEAYLVEAGQEWREDSSNRDLRHTRNRVRHGILPRLERNLNPAVREALAETAEIARAEEDYWETEVARVLPQVWRGGALDRAILAKLPLSLQRRVVRAAAESLDLRLEFRHVEGILEVVGKGSAKSAALPDDWIVSRSRTELRFEATKPGTANCDYEYCLQVPGLVEVPEVGTRFEAALVPGTSEAGYNPEHLLDRSSLAKQLTVRNWRAGDRFWPAHSKSPKKIKELLQERQVSGLEKKLWPVVASGAEVVWVRGFPAPARLQPRGGTEAVLVQEIRRSGIS